jgi:hypothetical protein
MDAATELVRACEEANLYQTLKLLVENPDLDVNDADYASEGEDRLPEAALCSFDFICLQVICLPCRSVQAS